MEILIADDTPAVTAGVKHFLEADGQQVESTTDPVVSRKL